MTYLNNNSNNLAKLLLNIAKSINGNFLQTRANNDIKNTTQFQNTKTETPNNVTGRIKISQSDTFIVDSKLTLIENQETVEYLKQVLQLPKDFSKLVQLLSQKSDQNKGLITTEVIHEFIEAHAKNGMNRLSEIMEELKQGKSIKREVLNDVLKIVSNLAGNTEQTPVQLMKAIILLYLPWIPLDKNIDFQLQFNSKNDNENESGLDSITIIIQTINWGIVKVVLTDNTDITGQISIKISCAKVFPKEELTNSNYCKDNKNTVSTILYEEIELQKTQLQDNKQKIDMQTCNKINPRLIQVAQDLIYRIIDLDKRVDLRENRKNMLRNK